MKPGAILLLICGACAVAPAVAHVRSQSHSVWEINGRMVDVVVTIPDIEAKRLGSDANPATPERLRDYLTQKTYALADGKRCALVPPVEILSALAGFSKFDFTFTCATAANLQIHSGAFSIWRTPSDNAQSLPVQPSGKDRALTIVKRSA